MHVFPLWISTFPIISLVVFTITLLILHLIRNGQLPSVENLSKMQIVILGIGSMGVVISFIVVTGLIILLYNIFGETQIISDLYANTVHFRQLVILLTSISLVAYLTHRMYYQIGQTWFLLWSILIVSIVFLSVISNNQEIMITLALEEVWSIMLIIPAYVSVGWYAKWSTQQSRQKQADVTRESSELVD